jgi:sigma-B regulation protein RsbU (phosphoserine phosphatase)
MTYSISCAEIWGGTQRIRQDVCTRGLTATIFSEASDGEAGGDLYYFSVCSYDILTRIAIADVRGHGAAVAELSGWLYGLLANYMNSIDGGGILRDLNLEVTRRGFRAMTTAAILSYNQETHELHYAYAGHPPAWLRRNGVWGELCVGEEVGLVNVPLGVSMEAGFAQYTVRAMPGDRLCVFSDGISESVACDGSELAVGMMMGRLVGELPEARDGLVRGLRAGREDERDDRTLIVADVLATGGST